MTTTNNFSEYYKTITHTELLAILENPDQYQSSAVEAARKELSNRQLSDTEVDEAKKPLIEKQLLKEKQKERVKAIEDTLKNKGQSILDTLNPIQEGIRSTEKTIRFIVLIFGILFLYQLIKDFKLLLANIKDIPRFPFESSLYLLPFVILAIAVFTFWKRKSIGWILLTIFLTFSVVTALWLLIQSFLWHPSGIPAWDAIMRKPPVLTIIIQLLFFGGAVYTICKQNIRDVFSISENRMLYMISITGVLTFLLIYAIS